MHTHTHTLKDDTALNLRSRRSSVTVQGGGTVCPPPAPGAASSHALPAEPEGHWTPGSHGCSREHGHSARWQSPGSVLAALEGDSGARAGSRKGVPLHASSLGQVHTPCWPLLPSAAGGNSAWPHTTMTLQDFPLVTSPRLRVAVFSRPQNNSEDSSWTPRSSSPEASCSLDTCSCLSTGGHRWPRRLTAGTGTAAGSSAS